ncbi:MAG: hypothetical protein VCE91_03880, partial [Nitrospinota bacterium]
AEARVLAMQTASSVPGDYGRSFRGVAMVFEVVESGEDDDYYNITLSFRPQGSFDGTPGQEQFVIGKDGTIAVRQVLSSIVREGGGFPVIPVAIGLVVVGIIAVVGAVFALSGSGGDSVPIAVVVPTAVPTPTETPAPIQPTVAIEKTFEAGVSVGVVKATPTAKKSASSDSSSGGQALEEYAAKHAGGPGAIYVGDLNQLVGPAATKDQGDFNGNVPLSALENHIWVYESDFYRKILAKANLTNPTPLTSEGVSITIQHACINRALGPCKVLDSTLVPWLEARTNGQLKFVISSFPELGLAGPDTLF